MRHQDKTWKARGVYGSRDAIDHAQICSKLRGQLVLFTVSHRRERAAPFKKNFMTQWVSKMNGDYDRTARERDIGGQVSSDN